MVNYSVTGVLMGLAGSALAVAAPVSSDSLPRAGAAQGASGGAAVVERSGPIIYSAPPVEVDGFFSDAVQGQFYAQRIADNFVLTRDATINGANWWGSSENFFGPPDLSNFASFTIEIFDGNFDSIYVETFLTSDTNAVATGLLNSGGGEQFFQSVKFSQQVALLGSTEYWISIGTTNVEANGDAWVWSTAAGDMILASDGFDGTGFNVFTETGDAAFELQEIPAPGAAALLAISGLVGVRRRR